MLSEVLSVIFSCLFFCLHVCVGVVIIRRRFNKSQRIFGTLKSKDETYYEEYSYPLQYQITKRKFILLFETEKGILRLFTSQAFYHAIEIGDSGMIEHDELTCLDFEKMED